MKRNQLGGMKMTMTNLETGRTVEVYCLEDACAVLGIDPEDGAADCVFEAMYSKLPSFLGSWRFDVNEPIES
jgi:hypothetical protein